MRRISAKNAKQGMVLSRAVFDSHGNLILDAGDKLTSKSITSLTIYGVGQILIDDWRVDDVLVQPTFAPELEAEATQALRELITESEVSKTVDPFLLEQVTKPMYSMTRQLYPEVIGEPNVAGCNTLEEYRYVYPVKVAGLSILVGRMTNYNMLKLPNLGIAALLMNIGYIFLPPEIRDKLEPLADVELQTFIKHPQLGYEILKQHSRIPPEVAEAVLHHHERCNGSGYPARLRESDISFFAKIISIVDTYYSLVSKRPQRRTLMPHEAIEFIMAYGGELFDLDLVEIFARQVPLYPSGVTVKLSTKETGIIADANIGHIGRPVVRVCFDAHSQPLNKPYDIDLSDMKYQSILVTNALEY